MVETTDISTKPTVLLHAGSGNDTIDEVYERIYMSPYVPAEDYNLLQQCGITHILAVMPGAEAMFEDKGIKYLIFNEVEDNEI